MTTNRDVISCFLGGFSLAHWECSFHPLQVFLVLLGRVCVWGACLLLHVGTGLMLGSWMPSGGRAGYAS